MRGLLNADNMIVAAMGTNYPSVSVVSLTSSNVPASDLKRSLGVGKRALSRCDVGPGLGYPQDGGAPG